MGTAAAAFDIYGEAWARDCIAMNDSVLNYLRKTPSVEVVILSSPFGYFIDGIHLHSGQARHDRASISDAVAEMRHTVSEIRAAGKRVVVVAPPPSSGFDIGRCHARKASGKLVLGARADCAVPRGEYHASQAEVLQFLGRLPAEADVEVIGFENLLCSQDACRTKLGSTILYRDEGHFSYDGSRRVAQEMNLGELVLQKAR
jgi:hypothetical protein